MRPSKTHLSFLILRPNSKVPFSEIKLAMPIPKEKDPKNKLLQDLKDGDTIEVAGTVFATALDEPWIDVKQLVKIASAPDPKKDKEKESAKETK
jgi:lysyl-tRNA synthetase class II